MARKSKIKLPKRVAGVKIPKAVRKGPVRAFVNSSAGRMLVAEALTAAVGLFAYKEAKGANGETLVQTAADAEDSLKQNTARLTYAFGEGVRAFREALASHEGAAHDEDTDDVPALPKKNSRRPAPDAATSP
jgi:hypothetical protein